MGTVVWEMGSDTQGIWQKALHSKPAQRLKGRVKNEAWQGKGTGRSVGEDKGYNLASHDSAPPSEDENSTEGKSGDRVRKEVLELEDLEMRGTCCNSWEKGRVGLKEIKVQSTKRPLVKIFKIQNMHSKSFNFWESHCTSSDEAV